MRIVKTVGHNKVSGCCCSLESESEKTCKIIICK